MNDIINIFPIKTETSNEKYTLDLSTLIKIVWKIIHLSLKFFQTYQKLMGNMHPPLIRFPGIITKQNDVHIILDLVETNSLRRISPDEHAWAIKPWYEKAHYR